MTSWFVLHLAIVIKSEIWINSNYFGARSWNNAMRCVSFLFFSLRAQLALCQHWFRWWLSRYYLSQESLLTHICISLACDLYDPTSYNWFRYGLVVEQTTNLYRNQWYLHVSQWGSMASCRVCVQLQHLGQFWPYTTSVNLPNWNTVIRRHLDHWHWTYIPQYVHKLSIWSSDWTEFQDIPYSVFSHDVRVTWWGMPPPYWVTSKHDW